MLNDYPYLFKALSNIDKDWQQFLIETCATELKAIDDKLTNLAIDKIIYPPAQLIFNALAHVPLAKVRVVILGQDPYHGEGEANGLAFAVNKGIKLPPSLKNIYKELALEYNVDITNWDGEHLIAWAKQGVLLLNAGLTVVKDQANSLANIGWQTITDKIIHHVATVNSNVVFILWGSFAQKKSGLINSNKHLILQGVHPSPLSAHRGFFGCNHFKLTNQYLIEHGYKPINWLNF